MPDRPWEIYTLTDPRTLRARYVGVTHCPKNRYREHLHQATKGRTHLHNWIRSLVRLGCKPIYLVLEYGKGPGWQDRERFWIVTHRKFCNLTNLTDGGDGAPGHVVSAEQRRIASIVQTGKKHKPLSPEVRCKMAALHRGTRHSRERCARISEALKKPVLCIETGATFPSITEAARVFGVTDSTIRQAIHKGYRGCGHYWRLVDTEGVI